MLLESPQEAVQLLMIGWMEVSVCVRVCANTIYNQPAVQSVSR